MATIIAAHDLSGVGRCSLTTALAVLPALGHTCYPLPTAILSQQTGLSGYSFIDFTPYMPDFLIGWKDLKLAADIIYTGFLGSGAQAGLLADFITEHPDALTVIDPVMGDNGELYGCYDEAFVANMRNLAKTAHILTPNTTEFNLLVGRPITQSFPGNNDERLSLSFLINAPRLRYIVITSVISTSGSGMCNLLVDIAEKKVTELGCRNNGVSYNGTGDLFASVLCGYFAHGLSMEQAVRKAADFVADAVDLMPPDADRRFGINYEPLLANLSLKK